MSDLYERAAKLEDELFRLNALNAELVAALERTLAALIRTDCYHHEIHERAHVVEEARAALAKVK